VFVRLDWLRATVPDEDLDALLAFCRRRFGIRSTPSRGAAFFRIGEKWTRGAQVSWGHSASIAMLDLQGGLFSSMTGDEGIDLLLEVWSRGWKITRLDGALDFIGQGRSIVDHARASCLAEELCGMRSFGERFRQRSKYDIQQKCVDLGRRDAEACVRIYDKGLEQGWVVSNWWERIEAEWKGSKAPQVAEALVEAGAEWPRVLVSRIVGAFDFREKNGRSEVERRPRAEWWDRLIADLPAVRIAPQLKGEEFARWHMAFVVSYGRRLLELAVASGRPVGDVVVHLLRGFCPSDNGGPVIAEFVRALDHSEIGSIPESRRMQGFQY
jgi:hypothetical protein